MRLHTNCGRLRNRAHSRKAPTLNLRQVSAEDVVTVVVVVLHDWLEASWAHLVAKPECQFRAKLEATESQHGGSNPNMSAEHEVHTRINSMPKTLNGREVEAPDVTRTTCRNLRSLPTWVGGGCRFSRKSSIWSALVQEGSGTSRKRQQVWDLPGRFRKNHSRSLKSSNSSKKTLQLCVS